MEESEIADQAFPLIFAFDEVVALGYRESVNLAQIRTFTEMDSHEEKVFQAVRQVWLSCDSGERLFTKLRTVKRLFTKLKTLAEHMQNNGNDLIA